MKELLCPVCQDILDIKSIEVPSIDFYDEINHVFTIRSVCNNCCSEIILHVHKKYLQEYGFDEQQKIYVHLNEKELTKKAIKKKR